MVEAGTVVPGQPRGPALCAGRGLICNCIVPGYYGELLARANHWSGRWGWLGGDRRIEKRRLDNLKFTVRGDDDWHTVNAPERPTTIGYSGPVNFNAPYLHAESSPTNSTTPPVHTPSVRYDLLVNPGILVHCKTTVPLGLLALETHSELFGVSRNLWDVVIPEELWGFRRAARKGGGGALVASAGLVVDTGLGSDVAGGLRIPAGWCGTYSPKPSSGRLPLTGHATSMPGTKRLPIAVGPTTRRMADWYGSMPRILNIMDGDSNINPGDWDSSSIPWDDGIIAPSLACRRVLAPTSATLKKEGCEVVDFTPPNVFEGLKVGYQVIFSDGGEQLGPGGKGLAPASTDPLLLLLH
ncbi:hypothetical protein D9619_011414 [Psilocybe cf. subviscida]|uniref:Amidase domain-containing protein n=1 Tax=Psilocybe cf. subviscida TaxID=2480587 RepID=A0A8H5BJ33_9AGAR|nr:hypothetical protein D9619_011414 [Psilocybe cf. subviscida]